MLAELVDAVVGIDTHRDTHEAEIAHPTGMPIATCQVSNDSTGYAELLAWILDHTPGPRLAVSIEGPQLRPAPGPRSHRRRPARHRVRATQPQGPPRQGQV